MRASRSAPWLTCTLALALVAALRPAWPAAETRPWTTITLSIVSTTDLHGFAFARDDRGGLALLAGYVNNLRAARAADGGSVLLVDAGDTFQGGIESNLSEGAILVDAFNAMGYTAAAVGNHEFDFGAVDLPGAREDAGADPHGALEARAAQAHYPFLAANLLDAHTGRRVAWPNVRASTLVEANGTTIGLIGVMTAAGLRSTLAPNVAGLALAPLAPTIADEANALRAAGATAVVVLAHAGGSCSRFDDPLDLASCDRSAEIFDVARALPRGLVDVIAAGHTHDALAHVVNGIAIVQAYPFGRAFARADVTVDARTHRVLEVKPFAPQEICAYQRASNDATCVDAAAGTVRASYEGRPVQADPAVVEAMAPGLDRVRRLRAAELGVTVDLPLPRAGGPESALGNLFADALRESSGADVVISGVRALRADLLSGPLTFGAVYDVFPFDNRLLRLQVTGADLKRVIRDELARGRAGTLAVSGVQVEASCIDGRVDVAIARAGQPVGDGEVLALAGIDSPVPGPALAALRSSALGPPAAAPLVREVVEDWLRSRSGRLSADAFTNRLRPRWTYGGSAPPGCAAR
ncbi:MAG: bifunctional UDP-sugar hydrolase/5'-nucleotidase [Vicinamibacterales bacterium]